jgi:hypothetical protein
MNKPNQLDTFMYGLMKEARRYSLMDFLENWEITEEEYEEIRKWFKEVHEVKL